MDLGDAAVLGMAESADQRHDVEAEFVIGQCEMGLGLGPIGPEEAGAGGIGTASDRQREPDDEINYSILVYHLSAADLQQALADPPVELFESNGFDDSSTERSKP